MLFFVLQRYTCNSLCFSTDVSILVTVPVGFPSLSFLCRCLFYSLREDTLVCCIFFLYCITCTGNPLLLKATRSGSMCVVWNKTQWTCLQYWVWQSQDQKLGCLSLILKFRLADNISYLSNLSGSSEESDSRKWKIWHISVFWGWDSSPLHMSACCGTHVHFKDKTKRCKVCCSPGRGCCSIWAAWPNWTLALSSTFVLFLLWKEEWALQYTH